MNKFISLIPRYLFKNPKRTFFISISIVISIILLTTVIATVNALNFNYGRNAIKSGSGIYHGSALISTKNDPIRDSELVETSGEYMKLGTENFKDKKAVLEVGGFEKSTYRLLNLKVLQGKYPEKKGEIALEKWARDKMFPDSKIGDSITIHYQQAVSTITENGTWKLVGILNSSGNNDVTSVGKAAITMEDAKLRNSSPMATLYFRVKNEKKIQDNLSSLKSDIQLKNDKIRIEYNDQYLYALKLQLAIEKIGLFLIIIVTLGAMAVIYNIFYITVIERIKEFSLLRAVGASKGEVKILILGEALLLILICVPIALIAGYYGIRGLFSVLVSKDGDILNALITKIDIVKVSIVSSIVIFISALSPAVFGGKVSPIEGIKENYLNNAGGKKGKVTYKGFNFTGTMACINVKKSRKRLIATVISLTVSIILTMCSVYLLDMFNPKREAEKSTGGDILMNVTSNEGLRENYAFNNEDMKKIEGIDGVKIVKKHRVKNLDMTLNKKSLTKSGMNYIESLRESFPNNKANTINIPLYGMEESEIDSLKPYLKEGSLDTYNLLHKSGVIVVENLHYKDYTNLKIGDKILLDGAYQEIQGGEWKFYNGLSFNVAAKLSTTPIRPIDGQASVILITSNETLKKCFGIKDYEMININVDRKSSIEAVKKKLMPIVNSKNGATITTINDEIKNMSNIIKTTRIILLGFSAILTLVALINISSTVSINVAMRKKELGVLRAVGMCKSEIKWMILKEGSIYGLLSSILGSIIGTWFCYIIYLGLRADFLENSPYEIPWMLIVSIFTVTVVITSIVSLPAAKRGIKNSIIESVKAIE